MKIPKFHPKADPPLVDKFQIAKIGHSTEGGQSLFEVIFALALAGIIMLGVVSLAASSVRNSSFSRNKTVATSQAQEAVEWLREQRDTDWADFRNNRSSSSGTLWCLDSSPLTTWGSSGGCSGTKISGTIFVREATLTETSSSPIIILVKVTVVWDDAQGTHEVSTETQFTPWGGT